MFNDMISFNITCYYFNNNLNEIKSSEFNFIHHYYVNKSECIVYVNNLLNIIKSDLFDEDSYNFNINKIIEIGDY